MIKIIEKEITIPNFITINDWNCRKLVFFVFLLQFVYIVSMNFNIFYFYNSIAQFSALILLLIPGFLILKILKIHNIGSVRTLVYSVGISLFSIMFIGASLNYLLPLFNVSNPLSKLTIQIVMLSFINILILISTKIDYNGYRNNNFIFSISEIKTIMIFIELVLLFIVSAMFLNYWKNNLLILISITILFITLLLCIKSSQNTYPVIIISISIALLFYFSLSTNYLTGADIHIEFRYAYQVLSNEYWDFTLASNVNSMLSISILNPMISNFSSISSMWVLKFFYPLIFSLVPLLLYTINEKQFGKIIALFSTIFFMSLFTFYTEMLQLARQELAEFFLLILLLLIIDEEPTRSVKKTFLLIIFSIALIVSHYGLSYVFILILIISHIVYLIINKYKIGVSSLKLSENSSYNAQYIVLFLVVSFSWYIFVASSSSLVSVVGIINHVFGNLSDIFNPDSVQGVSLIIQKTASPLHQFNKFYHLFMQSMIIIGIMAIIINGKKYSLKVNKIYYSFGISALVLLFLSMALPYFSSALNTTRMYQICLIFLSPYVVVGLLVILKEIGKKLHHIYNNINVYHIISIIIGIFLLFNTGYIYSITNDNPTMSSINPEIDSSNYLIGDATSCLWASQNVDSVNLIIGDVNAQGVLLDWYKPWEQTIPIRMAYDDSNWSSYDVFYLRNFNVKNDKLLLLKITDASKMVYYEDIRNSTIYPPMDFSNQIYSNEISIIQIKSL